DMPLFRLLAEQEDTESYGSSSLHEHISRPQHPDLPESELNPRFMFERFVANKANRMTLEAAMAVAENPASTYNPLLLYGGVGLGKTHLLQAIAHVCQSKGMRVLYIPSEAFTNDLIHAIRQRSTAMFREKYRSTDVLLVDDIQFISGKESTQEEFFHTFNALYTFNKQVILASDRHPRELKTLEDRLRSRFEGGLVVDVQPPEYETRIAILNMWANERGIELPDSVVQMMAERAQSNIRSLEGVFNQVVAKAHLTTRPLSLQSAQSVLERFERPRQHGRKPTLEQVVAAAAKHHSLPADDLTGKKRTHAINTARQIAMYLARELTDASLSQIGDTFGRSHTTVIHGCNKVEADLGSDPALKTAIAAVRNMVLGG
ncbi:MAG: chromosomal replication initiator protein DnaA, partial [Burkholderiales bacterium]|nr:chromosomal replication initiator protein DnaA [Anaerolineae bacterium]